MFFSLHFAGARSHAGSPVAGVFDVAAGSRDLASARAGDVAETRLRIKYISHISAHHSRSVPLNTLLI